MLVVKGHCDLLASYFREHDISKTNEDNFFKFGSNVHFESSMSFLEFGGQRSL